MDFRIKTFREEILSELTGNILPYWMGRMCDREKGGFYGCITGQDVVVPDAPKGGILNARILWTFSAAYRVLGDPLYLETATRARDYIVAHFFDALHGGTYWSLTADGRPLETKKQIYSQAFFLYAFAEYFRATGDQASLSKAVQLFELIEKHSFDTARNGYFEAYSHDWVLLDDLRLSAKDANEKKTMNTHLHILEAYTNLYRVWKNELLTEQLKNLIVIFLEKITDQKTFHLNLFFDEGWDCKSEITSYGHDIEASWLLYEAAQVLGDKELLSRVQKASLRIADASCEGIQPDGSLIYETDNRTGHTDRDRHWWPQAEAMVGFLNAWELSGKGKYLNLVLNNWKYTRNHLIDAQHGEWFWSVDGDGSVNRTGDKAGFWKCPYHNGRACMEIMHRLG